MTLLKDGVNSGSHLLCRKLLVYKEDEIVKKHHTLAIACIVVAIIAIAFVVISVYRPSSMVTADYSIGKSVIDHVSKASASNIFSGLNFNPFGGSV